MLTIIKKEKKASGNLSNLFTFDRFLSFLFLFFSSFFFSFFFSKEPFPVDPILRRRESPSARNHRPSFERDKFESLISCTNSYQIWTSLFQKDDSNLFGIVSSTGTGSNGSFPNCVFDSGGIISCKRSDPIPLQRNTYVFTLWGIEKTIWRSGILFFFFQRNSIDVSQLFPIINYWSSVLTIGFRWWW